MLPVQSLLNFRWLVQESSIWLLQVDLSVFKLSSTGGYAIVARICPQPNLE